MSTWAECLQYELAATKKRKYWDEALNPAMFVARQPPSRRSLMLKFSFVTATASLAFCCAITVSAQQPTVAQFEQTLETQLQGLKPQGTAVRTVRFASAQAGKSNGGFYPFLVTASIHDYGTGYPPNNYFGETCVGKMANEKFDMVKDDFGKWMVQGRMTPRESECKKNPAEGISSIPLSSVGGSPASTAPTPAPSASASKSPATALYIGEWACYGFGNRIMAGMGFVLDSKGGYADTDGARGGKYSYNAARSTLTFHGGFLSGQVGKNVKTTGFQISATVSCEPWR